tara:strand:+ start:532 stop:1071 length:540 start_codon:yes stop_codon:yes gene_type:complete
MAESFKNSNSRAIGVVTTSSSGAVGVVTNLITGISTIGVSAGDLIMNDNFIYGTQVSSIPSTTSVIADRNSTNAASVSSSSYSFLGVTSAYTNGTDKALLIGGTFANNTTSTVNLTVAVHDSSANTSVGLAQNIPVPNGSSFVISDAGKTMLESRDSIRVYVDSSNAIDVTLAILSGVS